MTKLYYLIQEIKPGRWHGNIQDRANTVLMQLIYFLRLKPDLYRAGTFFAQRKFFSQDLVCQFIVSQESAELSFAILICDQSSGVYPQFSPDQLEKFLVCRFARTVPADQPGRGIQSAPITDVPSGNALYQQMGKQLIFYLAVHRVNPSCLWAGKMGLL